MSTTAPRDTCAHDHHAAHGNAHSHLHLQRATERESDAEALMDPVCGMTVTAQSAHRAEHRGRPYYFCGTRCMAKFEAEPAPEPARYVSPTPTDSTTPVAPANPQAPPTPARCTRRSARTTPAAVPSAA